MVMLRVRVRPPLAVDFPDLMSRVPGRSCMHPLFCVRRCEDVLELMMVVACTLVLRSSLRGCAWATLAV